MHSGELPPSSAAPPDPDEPDEPVLVEAHDFSEDDDNFGQDAAEEEDDFAYEDEDEQEDGADDDEEEEDEGADEFESDGEEMSLARVGLHDLNTLQHFYRFGLINPHAGIPIRNSLKYFRPLIPQSVV